MRYALVLTFYLSDQLLSLMLPFSSGTFAFFAIAIGLCRVSISWGQLSNIFFAGCLAIAIGFAGAFLSGTPASVFFMATIAMFTGMWVVGAGLSKEDSVLISPESAFFGVLFSSGFLLLSVLGWDAMSFMQGAATNRGSGLYLEPSHYALFVMPLWLIAYQHRGFRPWLYASLVFSLLQCFSITLVAFIACALVMHVYLSRDQGNNGFHKQGRRIVAGVMLVALAYSASNVLTVDGVLLKDYVGTRLYGLMNPNETGTYNLTSLVVLQGLELAQLSFSESFGMGVGLGNFGISDQIVDQSGFRTLINSVMDGGDLNLRDGGILANKLVGELGILALAIPLILVLYIRRLKAILDGHTLGYHAALAVTLVCLLLVRALPYFSAPVCLTILSLAGVLGTRGRLGDQQPVKPLHPIIPVAGS